jgi:hypothetical protein
MIVLNLQIKRMREQNVVIPIEHNNFFSYCDMTPESRNSGVRKTVIARQRLVETRFYDNGE